MRVADGMKEAMGIMFRLELLAGIVKFVVGKGGRKAA